MTTEPDSTTLLQRLVGGTMYSTVGTGLRIISGVVATKVLATYLPSSDFGYVVLIELVAGFLRMISGLSIGVAAIRSLTDAKREEQKVIVDTVVIFLLITFVLVALFFLVAQPWVFRLFGEQPVEDLAFLILAFALVLAYQTVLRQMMQGFFRFRRMALIDVTASVLSVALLAVFLIWLEMGLVGAVIARVLAAAGASVLYYLSLPTKKGISFRLGSLIQMLRFSWPLQVNQILTFVYGSFGTLVVAAVMTPADVALLAVAGKIPSNIRRLFESFRMVYFPNLASLIAQGDHRRAQRLLNATLRGVAFLMALATVLVFVFQREIILLFYSDQYMEIGPILVLSMLSLTIGLVGNVLGNSTVAAGDSKAPPISNTVNTAFTVLGNLILVPRFGVVGAVLAGMFGRILTNPTNVWFLRRTGLLPEIASYVKPILLAVAVLGIAWWLQPESWITRLPFLLVFVAASFLLAIVTPSDIRTLWGSLAHVWRRRPLRRPVG